jgi:hypothetical protein
MGKLGCIIDYRMSFNVLKIKYIHKLIFVVVSVDLNIKFYLNSIHNELTVRILYDITDVYKNMTKEGNKEWVYYIFKATSGYNNAAFY